MKKILQLKIGFFAFLFILFCGMNTFAQTYTVQNTFAENFDEEVDTAFWAYNWAAGKIVGDRDGNTFKYETTELNNYYLGVILQFTNKGIVLNLKDNPIIKFKAKAENALLNSENADSIPIGMDLINLKNENIGLTYLKSMIAADGEWHDVEFDFSVISEQPGMDSIAKIRFNPGKDRFDGWKVYSGTVWIDDFEAGFEGPKPIVKLTTYTEDFSEDVNMDLWLGNTGIHPDSTPIFTVVQEDGALSYTVDQNQFYDGQFFNFKKNENIVFDLTENGLMSVRLNVAPGATYDSVTVDSVLFLASPWGKDSTGTLVRMVDSPNFLVPADGQWHEYTFDFAANIGHPLWNGEIPPGDFSNIESILFETVKYPGKYKFSFKMDDFKLGEDAVPATVLTSYEENFNAEVNMDLWLGNTGKHPDGTPIFTVEQKDGHLNYTVDQNAFWDGQFFNFKKNENIVFDLTENGLMSVRLNVAPGATYDSVAVDSVLFLASPWGKDSTGTLVRMIDSPKFLVPADGQWHEYTFDFAANIGHPLWNGEIPPGDFSQIEAILFETVAYPGKYKLAFQMDDFKLGKAAIPPTVLTSYEENFNADVNMDLWLGNTGKHPDGTPIFTVEQKDGHLNYTVDQNAFWDGQFFNFKKNENIVFDLTENGLLSVRLNVAPGATYDSVAVDSVLFLASPWGKDSTGTLVRMVDSPNFLVPADGQWHEYTFDFAANIGRPLWNGEIPPGDFSQIEAILFETVKYPGKYKLSFQMDDFKLGQAAVPPTVLTTYTNYFSQDADMDLWLGNTGKHPDGTPIFTVEQKDGHLNYTVDQNAFWDGQFFNFKKNKNIVFDLTENGLMSVRLNVAPGATYDSVAVDSVLFLASPWGKDSTGTLVRMVDSPNFLVPADGQWHEYTFDFAANIGHPMWNGEIPPGDFSQIEAILFETVKYPGKYKLSFQMDNFKLGASAVPPQLLTGYEQDFSSDVNMDLWLGNRGTHDDGSPIVTVTQENEELNYSIKQKNFWDGQFFNFADKDKIAFNLTDNGLMSVKLNVATGATYDGEAVDSVLFLASPWGSDSTNTLVRMVDSPNFLVPADGQWHEYVFDFDANIGKPMWNGVIPPGDFSYIEAILFETVKYPGKYELSFQMDDFRLGDKVSVGVNDIIVNNFNIYPNPIENTVNISSEDKIYNITVNDMLGNTYINNAVKNLYSEKLNTKNLVAGSYIISVYTEKGVSSKVMIKK